MGKKPAKTASEASSSSSLMETTTVKRERSDGVDDDLLYDEEAPLPVVVVKKPRTIHQPLAFPAHVSEKKQRPLPRMSGGGQGKSVDGVTIRVLVVSILREGMKLAAIVLDPVSVPYILTKKEEEYLKINKPTLDVGAYMKSREAFTFEPGMTIEILSQIGAEVREGSYGLCTNSKVGIGIWKDTPQFALHCTFQFLENPSLEKIISLVKNVRPPSMESIAEWQSLKRNKLFQGSGGGGAADTFNAPLASGEYSLSAEDKAAVSFSAPPSSFIDTTTINLRQLYWSTLYTCYVFAMVDNPITAGYLEDYTDGYNFGESENLPVIYYRIPTDTVKENYLKAEAAPKGSQRREQPKDSELVIPCIRENKSDLRGDSVNTSMEIIIKTPIYKASNLFYAFDPAQWLVTGAQLWRSMRGFLILSVDAEESLALHQANLYTRDDAPFHASYTGFHHFVVDGTQTMRHAGLEVSWPFVVKWFENNISKTKKTLRGSEWCIQKEVEACKKSDISKMFNEPGTGKLRLSDVQMLCLNDIKINLMEDLGSQGGDVWQCFMVPPNSVYGQISEERPSAEIMREQAFFEKNNNDLLANETYITSSWTTIDTIARGVHVFLVRRSAGTMSSSS